LSSASIRIDFYILDQAAPEARLRFACRLAEKAMKLSHQVHALAEDETQAHTLDDLLWTFRAESFVPHVIGEPDAPDAPPVTIGHDPSRPPTGSHVLINLRTDVPSCFDSFQRVVEIIDSSEDSRRSGRERFKFYRDNGYDPQTHRIS
jgi:DNA polymerase-3 subunit chi